MKCVVATLALLVFVAWNEAFYDPPALGPPSIYDLLTCIGAPIANQSMEHPPLVHLFQDTSSRNSPWIPPNSTVPLYHENYTLIFSNQDLQDMLIAHIGQDRYRNRTEPLTEVLPNAADLNPDSNHPLLHEPGCRSRSISILYPDFNIAQAILSRIECQANFRYGNLIPFYFPPWITQVTCVSEQPCSIPIGAADCAINVTCNYNTPMLMWDCCWTWKESQSTFAYECGWRNVLVPIPTGCLCSC